MAALERALPDASWVIVLAGGEGLRLRGRTVGGIRFDRPKQFCRVEGDRTLLDLALDRARTLADPSRILTVVRGEHRLWWEPLLRGTEVLSQPADLGNAVAIFHALFQILRRDRNPTVIVMPSDHGVDDEVILRRSIRAMAAEAREQCNRVILLGMTPDHPETDYGWIVPVPDSGDRSHRVAEFVEKPPVVEAERLMKRGALWNSFIFAATAFGMLRLFDDARPDLIGIYPESLLVRGIDPGAAEGFFARYPAVDFGRDVLARSTPRLRVTRGSPCGWIDLGTPARVGQWIERRARRVSLVRRGRAEIGALTPAR
ncbi:MAG TPA: sugar phosphate nucleotidyltransferase [Candidatus Udaeobacter sp.]|jgi:mannose-1-phosphate guanylyltransferase|nr:sugar phosphate nucleotidyltransferase [Candidatus Udaeobacter sp.]